VVLVLFAYGVWGCLVWLPARRLLSGCLWQWVFLELFACSALVYLFACGVGFCLIWLVWSLVFGLSLNSYWFISVAPVRGRHLLSLPPQRKISKESGSHR
jgi:hypothetical protein